MWRTSIFAAIGLIASIITLFVFISGKQNIKELAGNGKMNEPLSHEERTDGDKTLIKDRNTNSPNQNFGIRVIRPNGGDSWPMGVPHTIEWSSSGVDDRVNIDVDWNYPSGQWTRVLSNQPNTGGAHWTVTGPATNTARLRLSSVIDPHIGDLSDENFSIVPYQRQKQ
jgi:hypothetical protein